MIIIITQKELIFPAHVVNGYIFDKIISKH